MAKSLAGPFDGLRCDLVSTLRTSYAVIAEYEIVIIPSAAIQEVVVCHQRCGSNEEHLQDAVAMVDMGASSAAPELDIGSAHIV